MQPWLTLRLSAHTHTSRYTDCIYIVTICDTIITDVTLLNFTNLTKLFLDDNQMQHYISFSRNALRTHPSELTYT